MPCSVYNTHDLDANLREDSRGPDTSGIAAAARVEGLLETCVGSVLHFRFPAFGREAQTRVQHRAGNDRKHPNYLRQSQTQFRADLALGIMPHSYEEITMADIKFLAASIYEGQPRVWMGSRWRCPQCRKGNEAGVRTCLCGITRDGLPELVEAQGFPLSVQRYFVSFGSNQRAPRVDLDYGKHRCSEPSRVLTGVVILIVPTLLTWFGLIEAGLKLWGWLHG